jgi:hypothetical protein
MTYAVTVLARARQDVWEIHDWIAARSPEGADRWLERSSIVQLLSNLMASLPTLPRFGAT